MDIRQFIAYSLVDHPRLEREGLSWGKVFDYDRFIGHEWQGALELSMKKDLKSLPEGLEVSGLLYLSGCSELESLPKGLKVGGSLYLEGCNELKSLPEGLRIGGSLCLSGCSGLSYKKKSDLPKSIKVGEEVYFS